MKIPRYVILRAGLMFTVPLGKPEPGVKRSGRFAIPVTRFREVS